MKTGKYSLRDLLTHNEIDQMVIPELQRDYVWSTNEVSKVWNSFFTKFKAVNKSSVSVLDNNIPIESPSVVAYLEKTYHVLTHKTKMGFVYAYHDKEMPGKFFLIDGQQRLTTFYLVLLAIYVKIGDSDRFRKNYYSNGLPKIDYKVRESAYEFLRLFLDETLGNKDFEVNKNYFNTDYNNDTTVKNLIKNYRFVSSKLKEIEEEVNLTDLLDYIENYIEFNYFDTKLSEQGESLYLYMNSRGFHLSHQEKLRANLIEKESKEKKKTAGKLWEEWQDFFFEYKYGNENADKGFEDFLYFSTLLKKQTDNGLTIADLSSVAWIKDYQIQNLSIDFLSKAFNSLKALLFWDKQEKVYLDDFFVSIKNEKREYVLKLLFRYLPVWYYDLKFSPDSFTLEHFRLLILNQSHTRGVADQPSKNIIDVLSFVEGLKTSNLLKNEVKPNSFYAEHDFEKLKLSIENATFLDFTHNLYFDYKFQDLLEGRTDILFKLSKLDLKSDSNIEKAEIVIQILKKIFFVTYETVLRLNLDSKILRRYILSYFDFSAQLGYVSKYGERYNLISDVRTWLGRVLANDEFQQIIDDWLLNPNTTLETVFKTRKLEFEDRLDWKYYFIHYDNVINHMSKNHFIWNDYFADIILINKEYQSYYDSYLPVKILENFKVNNISFRTHLLEIAYLDLAIADDNIIAAFDLNSKLCLHLIYQKEGNWHLNLSFEGFEINNKIDHLKQNGFELLENGWWQNNVFFKHEHNNSLEQNLFKLNNDVKELIIELKRGGLIPTKEIIQ